MNVKKYKAKVKSITNPIKDVYTVEFESLGRRFKYHPGQFLHLAIDNEYDGIGQWPDSRCFSMQSNPNDDIICITYAVKGKFTKQMETFLKKDKEVWLKLPYGNLFIQNHSKVNTVFIAGGTGITPFLSLFTHQSFNEYENPKVYLGFRSKKYNIYESELKQIPNSSKAISYFYENIEGVLDIQRIFNDNGIKNSYFISGPPTMIKNFKQTLIKLGVSSNNILTDDWE